jgi:hypothetical protein
VAVLVKKQTMKASRRIARREVATAARPRWWRRLMQGAWAVLGWVPVTPLGLGTAVALAALIKWVAVPRQDQVLWTLAIGGLVYQAAAILAVLVTGLWLRLRPQGTSTGPMTAEAGAPFQTGYSPGLATWNPLTRVEITWVAAKDAVVQLVSRRFKTVEEVTARGRMTAGRVERRFIVGDIAHLARVRFVWGRDESITVRPSRGAAGRLNPAAQFVSGDQIGHPEGKPEGELIEMRRYTPGDPLKLVLWKLYARTGRLMVRTPERSFSLTEATRAYLVAGAGDEAAAGIARAWVEAGGLGVGSAFGADGRPGSARTAIDALDRVVHSVTARDRGAEGLAEFLVEGDRSGVRGCILFVPSCPGGWVDATVAAIGGRRGAIRVSVGVDGLRHRGAASRAVRLLTRRDDGPEADVDKVMEVVERLASAGAEVCVIDRSSGRTFRPEELKANAAKGGRS